MYNMTIPNTTVQYTGKLIESKSYELSLQGEFFFPFLFLLFLLYLYEKMAISWAYCGTFFTIHVIQTIRLYALNLQNDVCQLFLNKTRNKKREKSVRVGSVL